MGKAYPRKVKSSLHKIRCGSLTFLYARVCHLDSNNSLERYHWSIPQPPTLQLLNPFCFRKPFYSLGRGQEVRLVLVCGDDPYTSLHGSFLYVA